MPKYADTSGRTREAAPLTAPDLVVTGWPTVHAACLVLVFELLSTGDVEPRTANIMRRSELRIVV